MDQLLLPAVVAFVSSSIGALVLLTPKRHMGVRFSTASTGFCAGVMLGAAVFTLILPAVAELDGANGSQAVWIAVSLFSGLLLMEVLHQAVPHEHFFKGREGPGGDQFRRSVLIVAAIALHNIPEGVAMGAGFMQSDRQAAMSLLLGIGVQNIPEGLIVALSLVGIGLAKVYVVWGVVIAALAEAIGALLGSFAGAAFDAFLPYSLLACAGAMIYVVSQEMIPESHRSGHERLATFSLFFGFVGILIMTL